MSYTSQQFLVCDNGSNANFRAWGSAISAALAAMGWTQTADTGQVNWSTVTVPAAGAYVYEIWQPADAFQTGPTQYFLKLEYGNISMRECTELCGHYRSCHQWCRNADRLHHIPIYQQSGRWRGWRRDSTLRVQFLRRHRPNRRNALEKFDSHGRVRE